MAEETAFMEGGNTHFLVEMELRDANIVQVEPYAIYTSEKKRRMVLVHQISRAGAHGDNGWRWIEAANIRKVKVLDRPFTTRKDYDPFDKIKYVMMHYSIPNIDGKQRAVDLAPAWDKSIHNRPAGYA